MKTVNIKKAQSTRDKIVPEVTIVLDTEIRDADAANIYAHQAARLHEALYNSLPCGTYDRLLILMLKLRAPHQGIEPVKSDAVETPTITMTWQGPDRDRCQEPCPTNCDVCSYNGE